MIGRNEGERIARCLASVQHRQSVVYVDSGSADASTQIAHGLGAIVVELDSSRPFTAARARNAGFRALLNRDEDIRHVQFVDGDCELKPNWLDTARESLDATPQAAVVCGALIERSPETSIYNRLCALEWKSLPGETQACGGIFMIKREAFESVGGFNDSLIAGEESELCYRLRASKWSVLRLNEPMASHDAAITRFGQWCRRTVRSGHAYAERAWLHHQSPRRPWRRELRRDWFWGFFLPFVAVAAAWPSLGISLVILLLYPIWVWKIFRERRRRLGDCPADARLYALFCMLAKFPSFAGQVLFWWRRLRGRQASLIEYKSAE